MPKTTATAVAEAPVPVDDARQATTAAAEALRELEARRAAGDPAVTVQHLTAANQAVYLAQMALDDAERDAERNAREHAERRRADTRAAATDILAPHSVDILGQRWATARRELLALVDAVSARNDAIVHAGGALAAGRWPQGDADTPGDTVPGTLPSWLRLDGTAHQAVNPGDVIVGLVLDVAGERGGLASRRYTSVRALLNDKAERSNALEVIEHAGRTTP